MGTSGVKGHHSVNKCHSLEVLHKASLYKALSTPKKDLSTINPDRPISMMSIAGSILMKIHTQKQKHILSYQSNRFKGLCSLGGVMTPLSAFYFLSLLVSVCVVCGSCLWDIYNKSQRPSLQWLLWNIFRISIQCLTPRAPARPIQLRQHCSSPCSTLSTISCVSCVCFGPVHLALHFITSISVIRI